MALSGTEVWKGGFVVDSTSGALVVTTNATGAVWRGGYLRDPDGRLVVVAAG
jgi:hypothetical protein